MSDNLTDLHLHILYETLIITGGYIIMILYKNLWKYLYKRKITDSEKIIVTLLGTLFMLYMISTALNIRIETKSIFNDKEV